MDNKPVVGRLVYATHLPGYGPETFPESLVASSFTATMLDITELRKRHEAVRATENSKDEIIMVCTGGLYETIFSVGLLLSSVGSSRTCRDPSERVTR